MATDDDATEDGPTSTESATTVDLPVEGGTAELSIPPSATRISRFLWRLALEYREANTTNAAVATVAQNAPDR